MRPAFNFEFHWKTTAYFAALLAALIIVFSPSFQNPLRSDWWSALFAFHIVDASPGPPGVFFIVNHDPWRDGTFRPLSHPLLYLEHRLFGASFLPYHLIQLLLYFLNTIFLYGVGRRLGVRRTTLMIFLLLFAFLFTHFDIVIWTFHSYMLLSFSFFLLGFILYFRFLKSGNGWTLVPVGCLFLFAMLCLELYLLWPVGVIFLSGRSREKQSLRRRTALMVAVLYGVYLAIFILTRGSPHTSGSLPSPSLQEVFLSVSAVFFNLLYNGLLINFLPFLTLPLRLNHNAWMGGPVSTWSPGTLKAVVAGAGIFSVLLIVLFSFRRSIIKKIPAAIWCMAYFYATSFFILTLARSTTANFDILFLQFRYQYIPNALLLLMGALILERLVKTRAIKRVVSLMLILAAALNLILVRESVAVIGEELAPLGRLLGRIRQGIEIGEITPQRPLSIPDALPSYLPSLCWNESMGQFFRGTYQWLFSREEIFCFTPFIRDADWVVDVERLDYRRKKPGDPSIIPQRLISLRYRDWVESLDRAASEFNPDYKQDDD